MCSAPGQPRGAEVSPFHPCPLHRVEEPRAVAARIAPAGRARNTPSVDNQETIEEGETITVVPSRMIISDCAGTEGLDTKLYGVCWAEERTQLSQNEGGLQPDLLPLGFELMSSSW